MLPEAVNWIVFRLFILVTQGLIPAHGVVLKCFWPQLLLYHIESRSAILWARFKVALIHVRKRQMLNFFFVNVTEKRIGQTYSWSANVGFDFLIESIFADQSFYE